MRSGAGVAGVQPGGKPVDYSEEVRLHREYKPTKAFSQGRGTIKCAYLEVTALDTEWRLLRSFSEYDLANADRSIISKATCHA